MSSSYGAIITSSITVAHAEVCDTPHTEPLYRAEVERLSNSRGMEPRRLDLRSARQVDNEHVARLHALTTVGGTKVAGRKRRVSRDRERKAGAVLAAIPKGRQRPARVSVWLDQALSHSCTSQMTDRSWKTYRAVVHSIANAIDARTMTTRFTWASLAVAVHRQNPAASRRTIARYLALLRHDHVQLLATVASGRSAKYATKASEGQADAAIYVLTVQPMRATRMHHTQDSTPSRAQQQAHAARFISHAVNKIGTPPPKGVSYPVHAREDAPVVAPIEPLRGTATSSAAQARPRPRLSRQSAALWAVDRATSSRDDRLRAARTLAHLVPVARKISAHDLRSVIRPLLVAGWTINDIKHAIDHQPDGKRWPHSGADGVNGARGWLTHRLAPWISNGTPRTSPHELALNRHEAALAKVRADREQARHDDAEVERVRHSPIIEEAKVRIHAAVREAKRAVNRGRLMAG